MPIVVVTSGGGQGNKDDIAPQDRQARISGPGLFRAWCFQDILETPLEQVGLVIANGVQPS